MSYFKSEAGNKANPGLVGCQRNAAGKDQNFLSKNVPLFNVCIPPIFFAMNWVIFRDVLYCKSGFRTMYEQDLLLKGSNSSPG